MEDESQVENGIRVVVDVGWVGIGRPENSVITDVTCFPTLATVLLTCFRRLSCAFSPNYYYYRSARPYGPNGRTSTISVGLRTMQRWWLPILLLILVSETHRLIGND